MSNTSCAYIYIWNISVEFKIKLNFSIKGNAFMNVLRTDQRLRRITGTVQILLCSLYLSQFNEKINHK